MEELELTYLAKNIPDGVWSSPARELLDIYIPAQADHPVLRIRKYGHKYEMTKKEPIEDGDASRQLETTIPLTETEFSELNTIAGKRVQKTRYYYKEGSTNYEIDVFKGGLLGLVLVDVEFSLIAEKAAFQMPSWCLAEVTQESFMAGGKICGKSYNDIAGQLARFGYQQIINNNTSTTCYE